MTRELTLDEVTEQEGVLVGPIRHSVNGAQGAPNSIHTDSIASKLGFRGGTVAGSIHFDLFPPVLLRAFGQRWFERGNLSLNFLNATVDREPVRAYVAVPPTGATGAQVEAWIERDDGMKVGAGTAAVGDVAEQSALAIRSTLQRDEAEPYRILANIKPNDPIGEVTVVESLEKHRQRMTVITEELPWYTESSSWGGPIVSPAEVIRMLYVPIETLRGRIGESVGLFGAIELRNLAGPVLVDREYRASGRVLSVGQSPKTEYFWYETALEDGSGRHVAEMLMQLRFMKASSPLYGE